MKHLLVVVSLCVNIFAVCLTNPTYMISSFQTLCWHCMFPIKISGVDTTQGMPDPTGYVGAYMSPICLCPKPPLMQPTPGFNIMSFQPETVYETVTHAGCMPTLGINIPAYLLNGSDSAKENARNRANRQAHIILYGPFKAIGLAQDTVCFQQPSIDVFYVTEFDPLWQSDLLSFIINPESVLIAGMALSGGSAALASVAVHLACIADSASNIAYIPNDALFWCMGSWGESYPMNGTTIKANDMVENHSAVASRMLYKMHRELIYWDGSGRFQTCFKTPFPFWIKSNFRWQWNPPTPSTIPNPFSHTIGQTGFMHSIGKNLPAMSEDGANILFARRGCCAL